jgi:hypothetical protein
MTLVGGLKGGKGGFGAMLRAMGKLAGKRTKDFGACRDLSGRRLRHVNDELKIMKWQELQEKKKKIAKEKGIKFEDVDIDSDDDESGEKTIVKDWHLPLPSWAEGFTGKRTMSKEKKKQRIAMKTWEDEMGEAQEAGVSIQPLTGKIKLVDKINLGFCVVGNDVYVPFNVNSNPSDDWANLKVGDELNLLVVRFKQGRNNWRAVKGHLATPQVSLSASSSSSFAHAPRDTMEDIVMAGDELSSCACGVCV